MQCNNTRNPTNILPLNTHKSEPNTLQLAYLCVQYQLSVMDIKCTVLHPVGSGG